MNTWITLQLPHGNRKILALVDSGANEGLVSQRFAIENRLKSTPVNRYGYAVDNHPITIYGSHEIVMQAKDSRGVIQASKRTFYATDMAHYDVILGREWLRRR